MKNLIFALLFPFFIADIAKADVVGKIVAYPEYWALRFVPILKDKDAISEMYSMQHAGLIKRWIRNNADVLTSDSVACWINPGTPALIGFGIITRKVKIIDGVEIGCIGVVPAEWSELR